MNLDEIFRRFFQSWQVFGGIGLELRENSEKRNVSTAKEGMQLTKKSRLQIFDYCKNGSASFDLEREKKFLDFKSDFEYS